MVLHHQTSTSLQQIDQSIVVHHVEPQKKRKLEADGVSCICSSTMKQPETPWPPRRHHHRDCDMTLNRSIAGNIQYHAHRSPPSARKSTASCFLSRQSQPSIHPHPPTSLCRQRFRHRSPIMFTINRLLVRSRHHHHDIGAGGSRGAFMARRLVLRLGVIGVVKGAVESCATSGGALFHLIGLACRRGHGMRHGTRRVVGNKMSTNRVRLQQLHNSCFQERLFSHVGCRRLTFREPFLHKKA